MDDFIRKNNLQENVFLLGRYPSDVMSAFFKEADIMLLSLSSNFEDLKLVVPARLQSYMAAGKPVLAFADGEAGKMVDESNCGYVISADNISGLVRLINEDILNNTSNLTQLGQNGKDYFNRHFQKELRINNLVKIIQAVK